MNARDMLPEGLPEEVRAATRDALEELLARLDPGDREALRAGYVADSLGQVVACSRLVAESLARQPGMLAGLHREERLERALDEEALRREVRAMVESAGAEEIFMDELRRLRRREWVRIAWRDLAGWSAIDATLREQSRVADLCIEAAVDYSQRNLEQRFGRPRNAAGEQQEFMVLAMGKLGGGELNFSSDVDLVFLYPEAGETDGPKTLDNQTYFVRLGQRVIRLLDVATVEGFVFRVDMRLRPFGDSGPLAVSFGSFETYLQQYGRDWERYAYVKARPVTAVERGEELFAEVLRPFVYRRYLDFGVFESLRDMKGMIEREVERRELRENIKLGPGGIREIEFIAQVLQLLRGGNLRVLQSQSLLRVLEAVEEHGLLESGVARELGASYLFLRRLENRLQEYNEGQTHDLPGGQVGRARLAFAMGYPEWSGLKCDLDGHRQRVGASFRSVVVGFPEEEDPGLDGVWDGSLGREAAVRHLDEMGLGDPRRAYEGLEQLRESGIYRRLDETGRRRLDNLMPHILDALRGRSDAAVAVARLCGIIIAVGRRSAYFALLNENPGALKRLTELCARSDFLAGQVASHPLLLDELLDPRIFQVPPDREQLAGELAERCSRVDPDDLEEQMEVVRHFQRAAVFRVAVSDLSGRLPLMKVSDRLTDIAEMILDRTLTMARAQLTRRHGRPRCMDGGRRREAGFAVVAYGKLGGIELGYGSDLDLVFIHDSRGEEQYSDGEKPLDNGRYFARLTQRIVSLLSTQTTSGALYEVDMRLRPSGKGGLLVSSLQAFEQYQRTDAWTWEHQALLRARVVAGDPRVCEQFRAIRAAVLTEAVKRETLAEDVSKMRARMRRELSRGTADQFDIKQDEGGVADIEFIVQYLVLSRAAEHPSLIEYSDNIRQLDALASKGIVTATKVAALKDAYLAFRARLHQLSLHGQPGVVGAGEFEGERETVREIWGQVLGGLRRT